MDLAALTQPLVYAHSDTYQFKAVGAHLEETVPRVELHELPGAGHNAHRSQPEEFARLVRAGVAASDLDEE